MPYPPLPVVIVRQHVSVSVVPRSRPAPGNTACVADAAVQGHHMLVLPQQLLWLRSALLQSTVGSLVPVQSSILTLGRRYCVACKAEGGRRCAGERICTKTFIMHTM